MTTTTKPDLEQEVVFTGPNEMFIDPSEMMDTSSMSLSEFAELVVEKPSIGFNAHQRLYAALRMFGSQTDVHGRLHYNFLDDWVDLPNRPAHELSLPGLDSVAEELMSHLRAATTNPTQQRRYILFVGPPSTGKTTLVHLAAKTLDAFGYTPEGAVYTVQFDLSRYSELFKGQHDKPGLQTMVCPSHENPLNFLSRKDLAGLIETINQRNMPAWQRVQARTEHCPACDYVIQRVKKEGGKLEDIVTVRRLYDHEPEGHSVRMEEFRPTDDKSYDGTKFFGGNTNFNRFKVLLSETHPLVVEYGIGGHHDGPSGQRGLVHLSEFLKYQDDCLNEMLDLIQSRRLAIAARFPVDLDVVILATSNLTEYESRGVQNKSLGEYLTSRGKIIMVSNITVLDDLAKSLKATVFTPQNMQDLHTPPHYVKWAMAVAGVMSTLEPPQTFELDMSGKMLVYNYQAPPGSESEHLVMREELMRAANSKPIIERVEGVKIGLPYRFFQDLGTHLRNALDRVSIDPSLADPRYKYCVTHLANLDVVLKDVVRSYAGINEETRKRVIEEAIPVALRGWQQKLAEDVNLALMGNKTIETVGAQYLAMVFASVKKDRTYIDPQTRQSQPVDSSFLSAIHGYSGMRSPEDFAHHYANAVKFRVGIQEGAFPDAMSLSRVLLNEDPRFRAAVQKYVIDQILPRNVNNISAAFSPDNTKLVDTLMGDEFGYCKGCANFAIAAASVSRKSRPEGK